MNYIPTAARVLLAVLFVLAGYGKIAGYDGTMGYMASQGVPGMLLPLVIALELGGGLLLVVGFQTRWVALALALFTVAASLIFHIGDGQMTMFLKNMAITGGLLLVYVHGAGPLSLDERRALS